MKKDKHEDRCEKCSAMITDIEKQTGFPGLCRSCGLKKNKRNAKIILTAGAIIVIAAYCIYVAHICCGIN